MVIVTEPWLGLKMGQHGFSNYIGWDTFISRTVPKLLPLTNSIYVNVFIVDV